MNGRIERTPLSAGIETLLELYSEPNYQTVFDLLEDARRAARRKRILQEILWWGFFFAFVVAILWRDRL